MVRATQNEYELFFKDPSRLRQWTEECAKIEVDKSLDPLIKETKKRYSLVRLYVNRKGLPEDVNGILQEFVTNYERGISGLEDSTLVAILESELGPKWFKSELGNELKRILQGYDEFNANDLSKQIFQTDTESKFLNEIKLAFESILAVDFWYGFMFRKWVNSSDPLTKALIHAVRPGFNVRIEIITSRVQALKAELAKKEIILTRVEDKRSWEEMTRLCFIYALDRQHARLETLLIKMKAKFGADFKIENIISVHGLNFTTFAKELEGSGLSDLLKNFY